MSTATPSRPTAPLPRPAVEAMRSLEQALATPAEMAARYRSASEQCRRLAAAADFDGCLEAQDELAMCRCQLEQAGRLDLIGVSA